MGALALSSCGGVVSDNTRDGGVDGTVPGNDAASDRLDLSDTCAKPDAGPGFDSCCNGQFCNGRCPNLGPDYPGVCACGGNEKGGCPVAARCCWNRVDFNCTLPEKCVTCARVGLGAGIESCCNNNLSEALYCRGRCGNPNNAEWCTCGGSTGWPVYDGCPWDQICCPQSNGKTLCVADASTCP